MIYRGVLAERRRLDESFPWHLTGVVVNGTWSPAGEGIGLPTIRLIEAGGVEVVALPAFLAPDDASAVAVAVEVARMMGLGDPGPERLPFGYEAWVGIS